jgi:hypothetical protein
MKVRESDLEYRESLAAEVQGVNSFGISPISWGNLGQVSQPVYPITLGELYPASLLGDSVKGLSLA